MKDDKELVAAAMAGGPEAFAPIVERYQDAVFGVSLARVRSFHDAQDIAQTVFVEAFTRLDRLKEPARLGAWLRTMAIHKSIDWLRQRKENVELDGVENDAAHGDTHESLKGSELRDQVLAAIGKLGKAQRETVTLFYINGYSVEEVAQMQESPVGTVKARLHEARKKLKEEMMKTVEGVLKSEAPKEDFGERILGLLSQCAQPGPNGLGYHPVRLPMDEWRALYQKIQEQIKSAGLEGYLKAFGSPHWRIRRLALYLAFQEEHTGGQRFATDVEVIKKALSDPNKKIRVFAVNTLLAIDVGDELKQREFVPLLLPLLTDRSKRVRQVVAMGLGAWASGRQDL